MTKKLIMTVLFAVGAFAMTYAQEPAKIDSLTQATAAKLNGAWKGVVVNAIDVLYEYKVEGNKFTGTNDAEGSVVDITNGVIKGNKIEYDTLVRDEKTHFTGTLVGDLLTVAFNYQGFELTIELSKLDKK